MMTEIIRGKTKIEAEELFRRFHEMCTLDEEVDFSEDEDVERLMVLSGVRQVSG